MCLKRLKAVYLKLLLSLSNQVHKVYQYLLKNLAIDKPDQIWFGYITYIRTLHGFFFLVTIMGWYNCFVLL
jgi:putative transposase